MTSLKFAWRQDYWLRICEQVLAYRFPSHQPYPAWQYGCDPLFLHDLCKYWVDGFDAQAAMAENNRLPHFCGTVDGTDLHWIHLVGEAGGKRPLLLAHGWPGTFYEFGRVIEPLAFPSRHRGSSEDAFDVVVPSIPGFGFSPSPSSVIGPRVTARLFDDLMRNQLGYDLYRVHGTDYGAVIAAWLGLEHASSLIGIHLSVNRRWIGTPYRHPKGALTHF